MSLPERAATEADAYGRARSPWGAPDAVLHTVGLDPIIHIMDAAITPEKAPHLDEIVARLVAVFHPHTVVLFGSWATRRATPDSDVDLLVVAESDEPVHVRMARAQRALRGLAVPVDVFVHTPAEVARYGQWLSHTVALALREGREVCAAYQPSLDRRPEERPNQRAISTPWCCWETKCMSQMIHGEEDEYPGEE